MKKSFLTKILAIVLFCSMILPMLALNSHHDCHYDECMYIFYNDKVGVCVENAIDTACFAIAVGIWFLVYGGLFICSKNKNAISPFIIIGLVIAFVVFLAFIDPAKWIFVISLLPSFSVMIIAAYIDGKKAKTELKEKNR